MTAPNDVTVVLSARELELIRNALESFLSDFGHDEADILRMIQQLLAKLAGLDAQHADGRTPPRAAMTS